MPESKHRRKNKRRPRQHEVQAPPRNPEPSPTWVPATGVGLIGVGVLVILLGYLPAVSRFTAGWIWIGSNWSLVAGFVLISIGFAFLTRWQ